MAHSEPGWVRPVGVQPVDTRWPPATPLYLAYYVDIANNPAGRLYMLIGELRSMQDEAISAAWGKILGVPADRVGENIGVVAQLVPQLDQAVQGEGRERQAAVVAQYRQEWLTATFPLAQPFNQPVKSILPSDQSYLALGGIVDGMAAEASDGVVPSEDERNTLSDLLQATIEEVGADDLPQEVAHLILQRLSDVETALRHIRLGGPAAVKHATEALMGAVDTARATDERSRAAPSLKRVAAIAGVAWTIFTAPVQIKPALKEWEGYARELTPAQVHVVQKAAPLQIESGPQAEEVPDAEVVDDDEHDGQAADASG